ncbi:hypothetical protein MKX01_041542 [Papaver californicum]|nr:hypothetical protein MKX01_041542 [Papaver californicum]
MRRREEKIMVLFWHSQFEKEIVVFFLALTDIDENINVPMEIIKYVQNMRRSIATKTKEIEALMMEEVGICRYLTFDYDRSGKSQIIEETAVLAPAEVQELDNSGALEISKDDGVADLSLRLPICSLSPSPTPNLSFDMRSPDLTPLKTWGRRVLRHHN